MARLLFVPSEMSATAQDMTRAAADLIETLPRLAADASVVMPPAMAAETAGVIARVAGELAVSSAFYGTQGVGLQARAAAILTEESGGGAIASLADWLTEDAPVFGGPIEDPFRAGLSSGIFKALLGGPAVRSAAWQSIYSLYSSPLHEIESFGSDALDAEKEIGLLSSRATWIAGAQALDEEPWIKGFGRANGVLGAIDDTVNAYHGWQDSRGELLVGRAFTTLTTGAGEAAIDHFPITATANFLSLNSLKADTAAVGDMGGAAISGMIKGGRQAFLQDQHDLDTGNIPGLLAHTASGAGDAAVSGANAALNVWSDRVDHGEFGTPLHWIATGENWVIDKSYGPVSNITTSFSRRVGGVTHGAAHLVLGGLKDVAL